jgi:hypothetical protein
VKSFVDDNDALCVVAQWSNTKKKQKSVLEDDAVPDAPSIVAWTVKLGIKGSAVVAYIDNQLLLGKCFPETWLADLTHCSFAALFGRAGKNAMLLSMFEYELCPIEIALSQFNGKLTTSELIELRNQIKFAPEGRINLRKCAGGWQLIRSKGVNVEGGKDGYESMNYSPPSINALESRSAGEILREFDRKFIEQRESQIPEISSLSAVQTRMDVLRLHGLASQESKEKSNRHPVHSLGVSTEVQSAMLTINPATETAVGLLVQWAELFEQSHGSIEAGDFVESSILEALGDFRFLESPIMHSLETMSKRRY